MPARSCGARISDLEGVPEAIVVAAAEHLEKLDKAALLRADGAVQGIKFL